LFAFKVLLKQKLFASGPLCHGIFASDLMGATECVIFFLKMTCNITQNFMK